MLRRSISVATSGGSAKRFFTQQNVRREAAAQQQSLRVEIGHPMLRRGHMPFAIGEAERDQWVACMFLAMESVGIDQPAREKLLSSFYSTADFTRNQPA